MKARGWIFQGAVLASLLAQACAVAPANAVHDLAAIHGEGWKPRSPAQLSVAPDAYLQPGRAAPGFRLGDLPWYEVEDHRALELAVLQRIAATPPSDLRVALEATSWLVIELLADDHSEARVLSAAILSQFAGFWIETVGARPPETPPQGDLAAAAAAYEEATRAVDRPDYAEQVAAALRQVDAAAIDDPYIAARLLAGIARRLHSGPVQVTGEKVVQRTAVRAVLLALEHGAEDQDPAVARACQDRRQTILDFLARQKP